MSDILDKLWFSRHPKDALFLSIIEGYETKICNVYPNVIFFIKGDRIIIEYNKKSKVVYISYSYIWSVFESKFFLNHQEIKYLMIGMIETHLKLKETTPHHHCRNMLYDLEIYLKTHGKLLTEYDRYIR